MSLLNKIGKELVLALLNRDNRTSFTFSDVTFSPPTALPVSPDFRNTKITVYANPDSIYRGERVVAYWRLDVSKLLIGNNRMINGDGVTNTLELADRINQRFDMQLTADDIIVENIDTTILPVQYVLKTHPSSFAYIGQVELTLVNSLIDLGEVIPLNVVNGLSYPIDPELSQGNLSFLDANGHLLSAPGVVDTNMVKTTNGELEIYAGVHTQDPNLVIEPVGGIYEFELGITDNWYLDVGMGLLAGSRTKELMDLYTVDLTVQYTLGGVLKLTLVQDEAGDYGWSINGSMPSADLIYAHKNEVLCDTLSLEWFRDLLPHLPANDVGSLVGDYSVVLRAIPISSIIVKPVEINLLVKAKLI